MSIKRRLRNIESKSKEILERKQSPRGLPQILENRQPGVVQTLFANAECLSPPERSLHSTKPFPGLWSSPGCAWQWFNGWCWFSCHTWWRNLLWKILCIYKHYCVCSTSNHLTYKYFWCLLWSVSHSNNSSITKMQKSIDRLTNIDQKITSTFTDFLPSPPEQTSITTDTQNYPNLYLCQLRGWSHPLMFYCMVK